MGGDRLRTLADDGSRGTRVRQHCVSVRGRIHVRRGESPRSKASGVVATRRMDLWRVRRPVWGGDEPHWKIEEARISKRQIRAQATQLELPTRSSAWPVGFHCTCGFMGAILGMLMGASFLLLWFSITYSPFAPPEWVSSVSVEKRNRSAGERRESGFATDHPVALIAFGAPIALGATAGAVLGAVGGVYQEK